MLQAGTKPQPGTKPQSWSSSITRPTPGGNNASSWTPSQFFSINGKGKFTLEMLREFLADPNSPNVYQGVDKKQIQTVLQTHDLELQKEAERIIKEKAREQAAQVLAAENPESKHSILSTRTGKIYLAAGSLAILTLLAGVGYGVSRLLDDTPSVQKSVDEEDAVAHETLTKPRLTYAQRQKAQQAERETMAEEKVQKALNSEPGTTASGIVLPEVPGPKEEVLGVSIPTEDPTKKTSPSVRRTRDGIEVNPQWLTSENPVERQNTTNEILRVIDDFNQQQEKSATGKNQKQR